MPSSSLTPHIRRILSVAPGHPSVVEQQHAIEHLMIAALRGGRAAGERLVGSLADDGFVLHRLDALPCMWRVETPPPRVLELWFTGGDEPVIGSLSYRVGKPWGSPKQRAAAKLQSQFYSRYEELGTRREETRLTPQDRLILLVGDFEADVNNGGLGQYLDNKGVATARRALRALKTIGAKRTAGWLAAALKAPQDREALDRLDAMFRERPEDLAVLVLRYLSRRAKREKPQTIAAYVRSAPREGQPHLRRLYAILKKVAPKTQEAIKWGSPHFVDPRFVFAFSAHKAHLDFAPGAAALHAFRKDLKAHRTTKNFLQVRYDEPLPETLIRRIATYRLRNMGDGDSFW